MDLELNPSPDIYYQPFYKELSVPVGLKFSFSHSYHWAQLEPEGKWYLLGCVHEGVFMDDYPTLTRKLPIREREEAASEFEYHMRRMEPIGQRSAQPFARARGL